jgi:hypothetical protein
MLVMLVNIDVYNEVLIEINGVVTVLHDCTSLDNSVNEFSSFILRELNILL